MVDQRTIRAFGHYFLAIKWIKRLETQWKQIEYTYDKIKRLPIHMIQTVIKQANTVTLYIHIVLRQKVKGEAIKEEATEKEQVS